MLAALDHVEVARSLPRHLKLYALGGVNSLLFGVPLPEASGGPKVKATRTYWLDYAAASAAAAGHPVPATVKLPKKREPLAWGGMLEGYADKLRGDVDGLARDTRLHNVVAVVVQRIDAEYRAEVNALTGVPSQPAPAKGSK